MKAIDVQDLEVYFPSQKGKRMNLAARASFSVEQGQIVVLLGPSGCGKSTILRAIAGTIPHLIPAKVNGSITILGEKPSRLRAGMIDMVLQQGTLLPWRSALSNVTLGQEVLHRRSVDAEELLEKVGLGSSDEKSKYPKALSGGMKQRVSLASSLATKAPILLMDEPFGQLDPLTRETMWRLVETLRAEGYIESALLVTHSIEEAVVLGDKVIVMQGCNPGTIGHIIEITLARPRFSRKGIGDRAFFDLANTVRQAVQGGEV